MKKDPLYKKQIGLLTKDIQKLSTKYNSYTSGQSYFVVNTTDNRFSLFTNKNLIREGSCSTGSYIMLQAATGNKKWIFKTPRGKYWIHGKKTNPVWKRPDWSFVEEGAKIPSANDDSRFEYGVLGDYALTLGDGYMIHGTIYKRFLGMPVTHGCVRLNDDDLEGGLQHTEYWFESLYFLRLIQYGKQKPPGITLKNTCYYSSQYYHHYWSSIIP